MRRAAAYRLAAPLRARLAERGFEPLYRTIELQLTAVLAAMERAGVRMDTYRIGRSPPVSPTASRSSRSRRVALADAKALRKNEQVRKAYLGEE